MEGSDKSVSVSEIVILGKMEDGESVQERKRTLTYKGVGMDLAGRVRVKETREVGAHGATESVEEQLSFELSPRSQQRVSFVGKQCGSKGEVSGQLRRTCKVVSESHHEPVFLAHIERSLQFLVRWHQSKGVL